MDSTLREMRISAAFVSVADTLTTEYDEVDLLHTLVTDCVDILDMTSGGLMLTDRSGELHLITTTSAGAKFVEIMALNASEGPCIDCFTTGTAVSVGDIRDEQDQWPAFVAAAVEQDYRSVLATPMKLRGTVIGTMNLFGSRVGEVSARDAALAQALADVATIAILQERVITEKQVLEEHLHRALDSRIVIEQAKGFLASSLSLSMDEAFALLRKYARDRNLTIRSVSEGVSDGSLTVQDLSSSESRRVAN